MTADAVDDKVRLVRDAAIEAERYDDIEMNIRAFMVFVTDDVHQALDTLSQFTGAPTEVIAELAVRAGRTGRQDRRRAAGTPRSVGLQLRHRRSERRRHLRPRRRRPRRNLTVTFGVRPRM